MSKEVSPEERLLHLIRTGQDKKETESKSAPVTPEAALDKKTEEPQAESAVKKRTLPGINLSLNFLLIVVAIFSLIYLGREIFKLKDGKIALPSQPQIKVVSLSPEEKKDEEGPAKPYSYYSQEIGKKDLFKTSVLQGEEKQTITSSASLADLTANLILMGIVLDDRPQAIIQDKKTQKSYFLYKGDSIGEIKVEDILESKVILSYQGEKIELVP